MTGTPFSREGPRYNPKCLTCNDKGLIPATTRGSDGYEECPECTPPRVATADPTPEPDPEAEFLAASVAVWREIDRLSDEPGGYRGLDASTELRRRERAAWVAYREALSGTADPTPDPETP